LPPATNNDRRANQETMTTIRAVSESDFSDVASFFTHERELHYAFPRATFPPDAEQLRTIISQRSEGTVLLESGTAAGFADLYDIIEGERCYIGNMVIGPGHRRKGLAKMLLREMIQKALQLHGVKTVSIICWCENTEALLLYHACGFRPTELIVREFDGKEVPVLLLEKTLHGK